MRSMIVLATLGGIAAATSVAPAPAAAQESFWDDFETSSSEVSYALAALNSNLVLYEHPDLRAPTRTIPYRVGWDVPYHQQLVRTLEPMRLNFSSADSIPALCEQDEARPTLETTLDVAAGEEWIYLHYAGEGFVVGIVQALVCEFEGPRELFHPEPVSPEVQIWFEVRYADGTSPGWLFLEKEPTQVRVSFNF